MIEINKNKSIIGLSISFSVIIIGIIMIFPTTNDINQSEIINSIIGYDFIIDDFGKVHIVYLEYSGNSLISGTYNTQSAMDSKIIHMVTNNNTDVVFSEILHSGADVTLTIPSINYLNETISIVWGETSSLQTNSIKLFEIDKFNNTSIKEIIILDKLERPIFLDKTISMNISLGWDNPTTEYDITFIQSSILVNIENNWQSITQHYIDDTFNQYRIRHYTMEHSSIEHNNSIHLTYTSPVYMMDNVYFGKIGYYGITNKTEDRYVDSIRLWAVFPELFIYQDELYVIWVKPIWYGKEITPSNEIRIERIEAAPLWNNL